MFTFVTWAIVTASSVHALLVAVVAVLLPVLMAGWTRACVAAEAGRSIPPTMLFDGFRGRVRDLAAIGAVNLMGNVVLMLILLAFGGDALTQVMSNPDALGAEEAAALQNRMSGALVVILALGVPLAMAVWFAPAAVVLDDRGAGGALLASLRGILRNSLAFLVYSLILSGLGFMLFSALSAVGIGAGHALEATFWLLMPLIVTSVYCGYRDIYPDPGREALG